MTGHLKAMSEPQTFRRLSQPVEAMQWTGDNLVGFRRWLGDDTVPPDINDDPDDDALFLVLRHRGNRLAELPPGTWAVVSEGSIISSCGPDEFAARYSDTDAAGGPPPEHLTPIPSDRGFDTMPAIEARHGATVDTVTVAESSAAEAPHLWLRINGRALYECTNSAGLPDVRVAAEAGEMVAHLTLDQARQLEEQLAFLRTNHYQLGDGTDA